MQLSDLLAQTGGLEQIARELGIDGQQAQTGADALAPDLLRGFNQQAQAQPAGGGGLMDILGQLGGGGLLDQVVSPTPTDPSAGNDVLGQIFGSKDMSRNVAQNAASSSGLDPEMLKKMLPLLAMVVGGFMAKNRASAPSAQAPAESGGLGGLLGGLLGGGAGQGAGGLASMLDANRDGSVLDDVIRMAGRAGR